MDPEDTEIELENEIQSNPEDDDNDASETEHGDDDNDSGSESDRDEDDDIEGEGGGYPNREPSVVDKKKSSDERIAAAERRAREADERHRQEKERADRLEGRTRQESAQDAAERERVLLESMTPEQRMEYKFDKLQNALIQTTRQTNFNNADMADKAAYDAKAVNNKAYDKYKDEVETLVQTVRKQGGNVSREVALKQILGDRALKSFNSGASKKQRKEGERNIKKQTTSSTNGRGNVHAMPSNKSKNASEARRERLKGITFTSF